MKKEKSAGVVIFKTNKQVKFLLLQNTLKKTYWEFPKGKIEKNESIKQTAIREAEEETNIKKIKIIPGFKYTLKWFFKFKGELIKKQATYLLAEVTGNQKVKINKEHDKYKWMTYQQALKEINIKSNREMLKQAYRFIKEWKKQKQLF
ncbi:MAG: bis(5'-nucleosyl)-tetraphosphatase [Candidatus Nanoarchaeia archaeon]